jgi:predicted hydrocarbon binding protein
MARRDPNKESTSPMLTSAKASLLKDPLVDLQLLTIDAEFYKSLRDNLLSRFGNEGSVVLYEMGKRYGDLMAKTIVGMGGKLGAYNRFIKRGRDLGYGTFKVPILKSILGGFRGEATIYLYDSFFASAAGRTGQTECWLVSGIIAGAANRILGKDSTVEEVKCLSKGDPHCEFKLA